MQLSTIMAQVNQDLIEKYQLILERDPKSKVFAPLAEVYRKMDLLKEAYDLCSEGLKFHPNYVSGLVAMGHILFEQGRYEEAEVHLSQAVELSPENILAQNLLARTFLKLKMPKDALRSYKMLLFLNPKDKQAFKAIQKLESLTADEFSEELFQFPPIEEDVSAVSGSPTSDGQSGQQDVEEEFLGIEKLSPDNNELERKIIKEQERYISLIDAFIVRNDFDRAVQLINEALTQLGEKPDLIKRKQMLENQLVDPPSEVESPEKPEVQSRFEQTQRKKLAVLNQLLDQLKNDPRSHSPAD